MHFLSSSCPFFFTVLPGINSLALDPLTQVLLLRKSNLGDYSYQVLKTLIEMSIVIAIEHF